MDKSPDTAPADWLAVLEESDADIAAGRVVAGDTVMRDLKDGIVRLENKLSAGRAKRGTHGRA
ncbi:hypothetical protein [Acidisoma silvae]|uniref:Uncharacterized protein n=1 Tax=Acidisoma silvae TaxID=2802396 RepID=A0A963YTD6_9PROT|nr:hypothetical protein [Acidisoma silvae]MCB8876688.1 hypothetical protein [Acidisoma silvae]